MLQQKLSPLMKRSNVFNWRPCPACFLCLYDFSQFPTCSRLEQQNKMPWKTNAFLLLMMLLCLKARFSFPSVEKIRHEVAHSTSILFWFMCIEFIYKYLASSTVGKLYKEYYWEVHEFRFCLLYWLIDCCGKFKWKLWSMKNAFLFSCLYFMQQQQLLAQNCIKESLIALRTNFTMAREFDPVKHSIGMSIKYTLCGCNFCKAVSFLLQSWLQILKFREYSLVTNTDRVREKPIGKCINNRLYKSTATRLKWPLWE